MIPHDIEGRRNIIKYMITACIDDYSILTEWEQDFIDSIEDQFRIKNNLTDTQCEHLEEIYDKL